MKLARPLLLPFVPLYRLAWSTQNNRIARGYSVVKRLRLPVVSIGNLSTGGTGKTPLAIALAQALTQRGVTVDILSRGYGRSTRQPALVPLDGSPRSFGDEPLLMARATGLPVYVAARRIDAGRLAESQPRQPGPAVHILDDGFQHRQLYRDIDILLLNREDWIDYLLPAGNLREPVEASRRASVAAIPAEDPDLEHELRNSGWKKPIWRIRRRMLVPEVSGPVLAFCGIARPGQFFAGLQRAGIQLAARIAFPDHHRYSQREIDRLAVIARQDGATEFLTTEKDAVRLKDLTPALPLKTVPLRVQIEDETAALDWLTDRIRQATRPPTL